MNDLRGKLFGELKVIDYNELSKKWICLCSCGKTSEVFGYNLQQGNTKSCGHLKNAKGVKRTRKINIMNEQIGRLLVTDVNEGKGLATVKCLQCKRVSKMAIDDLVEMKKTRKKTFTWGIDGCHYENPRKKNDKIKKGTKFGKLTVIKRLDNKIVKTKNSETSIPMYLCQCNCGNQIEAQGRYLLDGRTKSCGCLRKKNFKDKKPRKYSTFSSDNKTNKKLYEIYKGWERKYRQPTQSFKENILDKGIKFFPEFKNKEDAFKNFCNWASVNNFSINEKRIYLERKDYDKDFSIKNCFWTTIKTRGY